MKILYLKHPLSGALTRLTSMRTQWARPELLPISYHNIIRVDTIPARDSNKKQKNCSYRGIKYRLFHGTRKKAEKLADLANAYWFICKTISVQCQKEYRRAKGSEEKNLSLSFPFVDRKLCYGYRYRSPQKNRIESDQFTVIKMNRNQPARIGTSSISLNAQFGFQMQKKCVEQKNSSPTQ